MKEPDLTPEILDQLEQAAEKASPLPWNVLSRAMMGFDIEEVPGGIRGSFERREDVEFCCLSREWLPVLVAEVRRLREENADCESNNQMLRILGMNDDMVGAEQYALSLKARIADLERQVRELMGETT